VQRFLDVAVALLAAWTIVASRTFAGGAEKWLMFSAAATAALLAVHGLIAHEVVMEVSLRRAAERDSTTGAGAASATSEPAQIRVAR
jgi:membrane protein YdbS with pleckstrin-like domain